MQPRKIEERLAGRQLGALLKASRIRMEQLGRGRKDSHRRSAFVCISYHGFNFWGMGTEVVQDSPSAGTSNEGRAFEAPLTLLRWGASNAASALNTGSARRQKECDLDTLVLRVDEDTHVRLER